MATAVGTSQSCLFWGCQKYDNNIELCSVANIACVKWKATNIALGQYWFLLLLHGFIPSGPGQYGVLLPWLEEDMTKYIMSVLYPPIQEEMRIRRNIALGPSGLGQYFSVFSSPLGLGGTIRIHYSLITIIVTLLLFRPLLLLRSFLPFQTTFAF